MTNLQAIYHYACYILSGASDFQGEQLVQNFATSLQINYLCKSEARQRAKWSWQSKGVRQMIKR